MDNTTEVIRHQMEETRSSLQDKLETLEEQVKGTVQEAADTVEAVKDTVESVKESVQDTVESVKESVHDTVESVKETFNLQRHMREHPWVMFAGATALGFVGGRLLGRVRSRGTSAYDTIPPFTGGRYGESFTPSATGPGYGAAPSTARSQGQGNGYSQPAAAAATSESSASRRRSWLSGLFNQFGDELNKLKGLAIGAAGGMVRDMLVTAAPQGLSDRLKEVVDNVTTKLGGEHIEGTLLNPDSSGREQGEHDAERYEAKMGRPLGAAQR